MANNNNERLVRISNKHDFEVNWIYHNDFTPLDGEIIIYDAEDETSPLPAGRTFPINYPRIKVGDGNTKIDELPFSSINLGENNKIVSPNSLSGGQNSIAGFKGYYIKAINYRTKQILLDTTKTEFKYPGMPSVKTEDLTTTADFETDYQLPYETGKYIGIINSNHYVFLTKISEINGNVVTYEGEQDALGFTSFTYANKPESYLFFVPEQPDCGIVTIEDGNALAFGSNSKSMGNSIALGRDNLAYMYGDALGRKTVANFASLAEGQDTKALGRRSHAEGNGSEARGDISHAEGQGTITTATSQHVQGKYNIIDEVKEYAHIVGNGTNNSARSNAHTLDWNGNAWYAGKIYNNYETIEKNNFSITPYRIVDHGANGIVFIYEGQPDTTHKVGDKIKISSYVCTINGVWNGNANFVDTVNNDTSVSNKYGFRIYKTENNKNLLPKENMILYQGYNLKEGTTFKYIEEYCNLDLTTKLTYHDMTYPIQNCYQFYDGNFDIVITADLDKLNEVPYIKNGQNLKLTYTDKNGIESTIDDCYVLAVWSPNEFARFDKDKDILGNSPDRKNMENNYERTAAFAISSRKGKNLVAILQNAFPNPEQADSQALKDGLKFQIETSSLHFAQMSDAMKQKSINNITLGHSPIITNSTLLAIGNSALISNNLTEQNNVLEIKNNGETILNGNLKIINKYYQNGDKIEINNPILETTKNSVLIPCGSIENNNGNLTLGAKDSLIFDAKGFTSSAVYSTTLKTLANGELCINMNGSEQKIKLLAPNIVFKNGCSLQYEDGSPVVVKSTAVFT